MGKNQHSKDKLYVTATEWSSLYGGKKKETPGASSKYKKLPFDCCAISLQPTEHPVCTRDGSVFDLVNIVPFINKHKVHPVTGKSVSLKDLIKLTFHKNQAGKYQDPVSLKEFNGNTHIVAIATTGNVYEYDTVKNFNMKCNNWCDLMSEEKFTRDDIISIQDPSKPEKNNFTNFYHVKKGLKLKKPSSSSSSSSSNVRVNSSDTKAIMDEVSKSKVLETNKKYSSALSSDPMAAPQDKDHTAHFSTGEVSSSFTSTHLNIRTKNTSASINEDVVRYTKIKDKGYVRMRTNYGELNIELHCDIAPKTCENFIKHAYSGYYKNTIFHRNIRNFVIQGGDPTGTGKGGESAFDGGKPFKDEFSRRLTHGSRGVLSMANSGKDSNKSQFFFTYRACKELDRKHTVFGKVVGGMDTLMAMERIPTDDKDKPTKEIKLFDIQVFKDPFKDYEESLVTAAEDEKKRKLEEAARKEKELQVYRTGVGKYISKKPTSTTSSSSSTTTSSTSAKRSFHVSSSQQPNSLSTKQKKPKKTSGGGFGDFSSW
eukprot:m.88742 g.88742  ORF g.88742 m.88742 type:complete len:540 (+) comp12273_c4_seq7:44-1663(+)